MRKIVFTLIMLMGLFSFAVACTKEESGAKTEIDVYYVDSAMNRLLPYTEEIPESDKLHMARSAVECIIRGRDDNEGIRRLIPNIPDCVTVNVEDNIAYVNLSSAISDELPSSGDIEKLIIYQLVDTITGIRGIRFVKFTVDGNIHKDFMGYYDMRETYKFVYPE